MWKKMLCIVGVTCGSLIAAPSLQSQLEKGNFKAAVAAYGQGETNEACFVRAIAQLGNSVQTLQQTMYRHGLENGLGQNFGMGLAMPSLKNPAPEKATYQKLRAAVEQFHTDLHTLEKIMEKVGEDDFYLPLNLTKMRTDVNGDGKCSPEESMMALFARMMSGGQGLPDEDELGKFDGTVGFDRSDLRWLKGYTQVMLGMTDMVLAHDFEAPFETLAHLFFSSRKSPFPGDINLGGFLDGQVFDAVAAIHLMKMKVVEPKRLAQARVHFLQMATESRLMWKSILAEKDNRKEWVPSPTQESVTGMKFTKKQVTQWHKFLDEYEAILEGKKLLPHFRVKEGGVNLKRVFNEAKETDLVLWVTGHAALPYIEKGELTDREMWMQLQRTFDGGFLTSALFVN